MSPIAAGPGFAPGDVFAFGLLFAGLAVFAAIGALSHQKERAFSASLIYLGLGVLAAAVMTTFEIGWLSPIDDAKFLEHLCEFALVAALFSSGMKLERALRWREWGSVMRLLLIGMPLTIALVALFGAQVMGLSLGAAIILGAVLAPTDPVLAGDIGVGPPGDETEHEPNFALTAEAGFNDGLAFPFVILGVIVAEAAGDAGQAPLLEWLVADGLYAIPVGMALGGLLGYGLGGAIVRLRDRDLLAAALDPWVGIAAGLTIYGAAEAIDAYGFLAVFAGGIGFRRYEHGHQLNARVHHGAELTEKFGELAVILMLGSMLTLEGLAAPGPEGWALALILLLVIRPLTALVALIGGRIKRRGERTFVAWFGVRGVGTLYYLAFVAVEGVLSREELELVVCTALAGVRLSIPVHGITGGPWVRRLVGTWPDEGPGGSQRAPEPAGGSDVRRPPGRARDRRRSRSPRSPANRGSPR